MERWKAAGKAVIVAEHRLGYLTDLADRVIVLTEGRVVAQYSGHQFRALANDDEGLAGLGLRRVTAPRTLPPDGPIAGPVLEIAHLTYSHSRRHVAGTGTRQQQPALDLEHLSFPQGQITALIGTNGAGKSTLARWLAGLSPNQGGVLLEGGAALTRRQRRRRTFLVLQDVNHQLVTESVAQEIEVTLRLAGAKDSLAPECERILECVDLTTFRQRHPMSLSGGQKQRLAIATALASGREIVILDEPTSGLDAAHMIQVAAALRELKNVGRTVIVITHDMELVSLCADHVVELDRGRVRSAPSQH